MKTHTLSRRAVLGGLFGLTAAGVGLTAVGSRWLAERQPRLAGVGILGTVWIGRDDPQRRLGSSWPKDASILAMCRPIAA
jgi:hypothetical protein